MPTKKRFESRNAGIQVLAFAGRLKVQEADRLGVPVYDHVPALRASAEAMALTLDEAR